MGQIAIWVAICSIPLLATASLIWLQGTGAGRSYILHQGAVQSGNAPSTRPAAHISSAKSQSPKFDVIRLDPDGASVFAGRAPSETLVTVLANDMPIASSRSDENGEWAIVVEHKFSAGDHHFTLGSEDGTSTGGQTLKVRSVGDGADRGQQTARPLAAEPKPITFPYATADLTLYGRSAAADLNAYIQAQRFEVVTLSGHADERGSQSYNIELSLQRLNVVADYLRQHGFSGRLVLLPKGKAEPFVIPHRQLLMKDDAHQLDRRVEFRLGQ